MYFFSYNALCLDDRVKKGEDDMDNYGSLVNNYELYVNTPGGMENVLGRTPAIDGLDIKPGEIVLEVGPATGVNGPRMRALGANVIGVDVAADALKVARERDPGSTYIHYDGVHLIEAVDGRRFDGILASFSFCTIPDPTLRSLLAQMRQLLNPGGRLSIIEPNLQEALGMKYDDLEYHAQPGVKSGDYVRVTLGVGDDACELKGDIYRRWSDYLNMLHETGFKIEEFCTPRPEGLDMVKWWKAMVVPPFLRILAT